MPSSDEGQSTDGFTAIHHLTERKAFELQAYLAPITREFGSLGIGYIDRKDRRGGRRVVTFERRWATLRAKHEHPAELSKFIDELIDELRNADAA